MTQIDWSKAPEGATHYGPAVEGEWLECWHKNVNGEWLGWLADGDTRWSTAGNSNSRIKQFIPRPQEWTGSGLPPVGTVCEFMKHNSPPAPEGKWLIGEILYLSHFTVIISGDMCEHVHHPRNCSFRPIRTPAQLAAEEREKAIEDMWSVYWQPDVPTAKAALGLLWDAGYRKVEVKP